MMPYKERWKRTEAVRRFRRRQREQRLQARNIWNPVTASQTGSFAQTKQESNLATWLFWGISALGLLAITARINSPRM
jgi:hypothetical protein